MLSIKTLTFLGFALVAFPLVLALLNSANQVNELSKQGADSIFTVAELINTNQQISNTLKKMERYASQYLVLQDNELKHNYIIEQQKLLATNDKLFQYHDNEIKRLTKQFSQAVLQVHQRIIITDSALPNKEEPITITSLEVLQKQFKRLININEKINTRSREFINYQAQKIKKCNREMVLHELFPIFLLYFPKTLEIKITRFVSPRRLAAR